MDSSHIVERPSELLAFLCDQHPQTKKTTLRQWLAHGWVRVNGETVTKARHPLCPGDRVSVRSTRDPRAAEELPGGLTVRYEDAALLVVEKPERLLSIATAAERSDTAYAWLMRYVRARTRGRGRVWIVHRLDREVSGLMVFAKTEAAKRRLQESWAGAEKRYLAVVEGEPPTEEGVLGAHLDESRPFKVVSAPRSDRTRHAATRYRVLDRTRDRALVELTLLTGRRHQIRVHLADAGCPIAGDGRYGASTDPAGRLALHASFLSFRHPSTGELLAFDSALPTKLARLV